MKAIIAAKVAVRPFLVRPDKFIGSLEGRLRSRVATASLTMRYMRSFLIAICLVASLLVCACGFPRMVVDYGEMGDSPIDTIIKNQWMSSEKAITKLIVRLIDAHQGAKGSPLVGADIEKLGATCSDEGSRTCLYLGKLNYRLEGVPKETAARSTGQVEIRVSIEIEANPITVTTKIDTTR
jgi:hypothetical protein